MPKVSRDARRTMAEVRVADDLNPPQAEVLAVTIADAGRVTGLGRTSIYEAINGGDLDAVKSGGRTLVLMASIRRYLASLPRLKPAQPEAQPPAEAPPPKRPRGRPRKVPAQPAGEVTA